ncbi:MAG: IclR family transcriptional regulator [Oscillospiraceae bacterium]
MESNFIMWNEVSVIDNQGGSVQSVERIFNIVEILARHPKGMPLQKISSDAGLAKSTAHRLLANLIALGYVVQDSFTTYYRLTLKMFEISSGIVNDMDIVSMARGHIDRLSRHTGEAVHLVIQDGADIVYVYKAEAPLANMRMSSHVGLRIPMYCTGTGKAILATMQNSEVERVWKKSDIKKLTQHTIVDYNEFLEQLCEIRQKGYAIDDEENELGIRCVAVALPGYNGRAQAAFSISGLAPHMGPQRIEQIAATCLEEKNAILRDLGWQNK